MSVFLMVVGAMIAGTADLRFDLRGYCTILATNLLAALYQVLNLRIAKDAKLDALNLMMLQNILTLPISVCLALPEVMQIYSASMQHNIFSTSMWVRILIV